MKIVHFVCFMVDANYCDKRALDECDHSVFPKSLPSTVEELKQGCRDIKQLGVCVLKIKEDCEESEETVRLRKIMDFINSTCDEDSLLFQVTSRNLECILTAQNKLNDRCFLLKLNEKNKNMVLFNITTFIESSESTNEDNMHCIQKLWDISCQSITLGLECDSELEDAVTEILGNLEYRIFTCSEEYLNEISFLKDIFRSVIIQEHNLENAIKKRK